jgi:predicted nucleic acid-binding Zn ribbon protein
MRFGKQHRHCPNCGRAIYDDCITLDRVLPLMCNDDCRQEWQLKYARMILGKESGMESPDCEGRGVKP